MLPMQCFSKFLAAFSKLIDWAGANYYKYTLILSLFAFLFYWNSLSVKPFCICEIPSCRIDTKVDFFPYSTQVKREAHWHMCAYSLEVFLFKNMKNLNSEVFIATFVISGIVENKFLTLLQVLKNMLSA